MAAERERLEDRVYRHLLQKVSNRQLEHGDCIRPANLAKSLNVSRTTVRKALSQLVTDGWMQQTTSGYVCTADAAQLPEGPAAADDEGLAPPSQIETSYWLIFDWILQGNAHGGENVIPRQFADQFSVSLGTVRQALELLTQDGVLLRAPRRGWRYRSLTLPDVVDTIEIRTMFEIEVLRRAGARIPPAVTDHLRKETCRVLDSIEALSERERRQADYEFHTVLVEQCTSSVLVDLVKPLIRRSMYVGASCPPDKRHQARSYRDHLAILDALQSGQVPAAIELLQAHLRRALIDSMAPLSSSITTFATEPDASRPASPSS